MELAMATLKEVRDYFGMPSSDFAREWKLLPEKDRTELRTGIGDGTLNY